MERFFAALQNVFLVELPREVGVNAVLVRAGVILGKVVDVLEVEGRRVGQMKLMTESVDGLLEHLPGGRAQLVDNSTTVYVCLTEQDASLFQDSPIADNRNALMLQVTNLDGRLCQVMTNGASRRETRPGISSPPVPSVS